MMTVMEHLRLRYPGIIDIRTAVIWKKGASVFVPDFWADELPENPWIHQPFEIYDRLLPNQLAGRLGQASNAKAAR